MFKKLLIWLSASSFVLILLTPVLSFADEGECSEDPQACFKFDKDGKVKPKSGKASWTFRMPPIKAGFVLDVYNLDFLPSLTVQALTYEAGKIGDFSLDVGGATSRLFVSLSWEAIPIIKLGPNIWAGYNIRQGAPAFGIGISLLDF